MNLTEHPTTIFIIVMGIIFCALPLKILSDYIDIGWYISILVLIAINLRHTGNKKLNIALEGFKTAFFIINAFLILLPFFVFRKAYKRGWEYFQNTEPTLMVICGITFLIFSMYANSCFIKGKKNAIFLVKSWLYSIMLYCLVGAVYDIIKYILGDDCFLISKIAIFALCYKGVSICNNKKTEKALPKSEREHSAIDTIFAIFAFASVLVYWSVTYINNIANEPL